MQSHWKLTLAFQQLWSALCRLVFVFGLLPQFGNHTKLYLQQNILLNCLFLGLLLCFLSRPFLDLLLRLLLHNQLFVTLLFAQWHKIGFGYANQIRKLLFGGDFALNDR